MHIDVRGALARLATCGLLAVTLGACLPATTLSGTPTAQPVRAETVGATGATRSLRSTTRPAPTVPDLLRDGFTGRRSTWQQDAVVGLWEVQHHGYGKVGLVGDGTLGLAPRAVSESGSTSAALITSTASFSGDVDITARMRTARQLRTGSTPNPWEVGWLVWHHEHDHRFYYLIAKPNGWELGKVDGTKLDPAGPDCRWPEYLNCRYDGAQRFLATGSSPTFPVGEWRDVRIVQRASTITVVIDGRELARVTDRHQPYTSGAVGLYAEDADVRVDRVTVKRP